MFITINFILPNLVNLLLRVKIQNVVMFSAKILFVHSLENVVFTGLFTFNYLLITN